MNKNDKKEREENHDPWLNLNLSLAPPQETPPPPPSVSVPMQQHPQSQQGMAFSGSQAPPQLFFRPRLAIHRRQRYRNNQDQPSSSRQASVPEINQQDHYQRYYGNNQDQPSSSRQVVVPEVSLQDQYQAVMMRQRYFNSISPPHHHPVEMSEPEAEPIQESTHIDNNGDEPGPSHRPRVHRRSRKPLIHGEGKSVDIPPPYPWAAPRRARIRRLSELLSEGIHTITGRVQCKHCEEVYDMSFNLRDKFLEVANYIVENKEGMSHRAPNVWLNPVLPDCVKCKQQNCVKPVIDKKRTTNWLFLLLGQMLGCCKLGHLKYCCKHTDNHRTGAKDRVLFLAYMALCKQLAPEGPFDVNN
ncbi:hypothetical protein L6164_033570 [Bauhinia variegata]|uniref:Uncharacterized protein n=1 Tax=Bauhinia variegata TaxID=167791 RepID=A0ACB9KSF2_BAUVA|nr:hypothetical protein L6164_033570 [Bauhinia variegata]